MKNKVATRILIENITLPVSAGRDNDAEALAAAEMRIRRELGCEPSETGIHRKSIDARRRGSERFVYSVYASLPPGRNCTELPQNMKLYTEPVFTYSEGERQMNGRPVIVGFGPAGMFCALALASAGYRPLVIERGSSVDERVRKVDSFMTGGSLDPDTNIQFGAGGAGTFSDGKLMTRIQDPLCSYILSVLVSLGAPSDIAWKARPHIGTDLLRRVVTETDRRIRSLGGDIIYDSRATLSGDALSVGGEALDYGVLVLSPGHSARDMYASLMTSGYTVEPKAYSVGVRIEHLQSDIDGAMYGDLAGDPALGHAEYSLSYRRGERGVYSFCMCPGGEVVAAASEDGGVVTNGMSCRSRDGINANAALAVSVLPSDYGATPAGAIEYQRTLERAAYSAGGGGFAAPCQTVGDFLGGGVGHVPSRICPTYMHGNVTVCDLRAILPPQVSEMLSLGLRQFDRRISGFASPDVPLTGIETRTSAPVRIMRRSDFTAPGHDLIYPCGEGAGYAGGIMSAAADGLRVARAIMERYAPPKGSA